MKLKSKIKSKKGETLSESIVAIAVFGILLLGLTDFMSAQINAASRTYHRDFLINKAQELTAQENFFETLRTADKTFKATDSSLSEKIKEFENIVSFDWNKDTRVLTLVYVSSNKSYEKSDRIDFALP